VITLGDLNDGPFNKSIKLALAQKPIREVPPLGVYNPFEEMARKLGTIAIGTHGIF
jgi:hypothetical protein